jgi:hypothetical protein
VDGRLAHWDRDTLVIDVIHFTDQTRFDQAAILRQTLHVKSGATTHATTPDISFSARSDHPKTRTYSPRHGRSRSPRSLSAENRTRFWITDAYGFLESGKAPRR